jgi:hypothetical protein
MTNGSDAAFRSDGYYKDEENNAAGAEGLTKREYFAAAAIQGHLANAESLKALSQEPGDLFGLITKASVDCADALIDALNEQK